ncbi:MAG: trypsin-like peptidase domain-containing protein [Chloroflexaceae bacterium]|jgi:putative serine protease PepD|nr:trypsin-like peptidase domain-containing protein [Chloroflexaceae bacterium]
MFPYRFDTPSEFPPSSPPPAPPTPPAKRKSRLGLALLLALTLAGGAVGGGAVGTIAASRWLAPQEAPVLASAPAPLPLSPPSAPISPATTIAGEVYRKVGTAVVEVAVRGARGGGAGSGVVIDASGLVLTNNHVINGARSITLRFADGATRPASIVRTDPANDLAVLQVELPPGATVAPMADSTGVQVGDVVVAIGNPFGLEQTVTQGIISAVQRSGRNLLQTDAPINPGNSGGPLLNANGEVIGINTSIASPVRGSVGIGFAVPINTAKQLLG